LVSSVSGRPAEVEMLNLAERYEGGGGVAQGGDTEAKDSFGADEIKSAAAE
jgi:hypothetical protein